MARTATLAPELRALVSKTDEELWSWTIADRPPLARFHSKFLVLLGDAAHPMWTSQGQGAAQSIEDAAVLGVLLSDVHSRSVIPQRLALYSKLRVRRAGLAQLLSRISPSEENVLAKMPAGMAKMLTPEEIPSKFLPISTSTLIEQDRQLRTKKSAIICGSMTAALMRCSRLGQCRPLINKNDSPF